MRITPALLALLLFPACTVTIADPGMTDPSPNKTQTMTGVELSTKIVEGKDGRNQRLIAPVLRKQLDRKEWMEYRLWARKTLSRPFAPDLFLEVKTHGPEGSGFFSARDRAGNPLAIMNKSVDRGRMTTETIHLVLVPKALKKNNNQGYLIYLRGEIPGSKARTYEIELPSYYHRGFMNRYKKY